MPGFGRKNGIPAKAETETAAGQADDARQRQETRQKRKPSQGRTKPVAYGSKRRTHCATGGKRPAGRQRATGKTTVACRRARQIEERSAADRRQIGGQSLAIGSKPAADQRQIGNRSEAKGNTVPTPCGEKRTQTKKTSIMEEKYAFLWDLVRQTQMSPLFIQSLRIAGVVRSKIVCDLQGNPYVKYSVDDLKRWMSANWEEYRIRRGPRPAKYNILSA